MKRKHIGSNFEEFLSDDGILEECRASAIKFMIARELENAPGFILAAQPTRGVDVGAIEFIHQRLLQGLKNLKYLI